MVSPDDAGEVNEKVFLREVPDCSNHFVLVDTTEAVKQGRKVELYRARVELDEFEEVARWIQGILQEVRDHWDGKNLIGTRKDPLLFCNEDKVTLYGAQVHPPGTYLDVDGSETYG